MRNRLVAALMVLCAAALWLSPQGVVYACGSEDAGRSKCCCPPETHLDRPGDARVERPDCEPASVATPAPDARMGSEAGTVYALPFAGDSRAGLVRLGGAEVALAAHPARGPPERGPPIYLRHRSLLL